ncbi:MAG: hypothetical protein ACJAYH_000416 [Celeribacter sp.]|jgi:hypothetical protein
MRFNGKLRNECFNETLCETLRDTHKTLDEWQEDDNRHQISRRHIAESILHILEEYPKRPSSPIHGLADVIEIYDGQHL